LIPLKIPKEKLLEVGWTRLQIVAKYVSKKNAEELITLAGSTQAKSLENKMKGKPARQKSVVLHFSPEQYDRYIQALFQHGAVKSKGGHGLQKKTNALMSILDKVLPK
jgi:hypothetical protein